MQVSRQAQTVSVRDVSRVEYTYIFLHAIKALCSLRHTNYTNKTHQHKTGATCHKNYSSHSKRHSIVNSGGGGGGWCVKSKQNEKSLQTLQLFRHPSQKSGCCQRGVERWKRLSYWTAARKHCLLGTAGQLHIRTYSGCESMSKTCASPSRPYSKERGAGNTIPPHPKPWSVSNC